MMWEEHPEYQKAQMRLIGLGLLALTIIGILYAAREQDWDLLRQVFLMAGGLIIALCLISGFVWTLIKIFTRKPGNDKGTDRH